MIRYKNIAAYVKKKKDTSNTVDKCNTTVTANGETT